MAAGGHSSNWLLTHRPLSADEGAALSASTSPSGPFQPVATFYTEITDAERCSDSGVDEDGDFWEVNFCLPGNFPDLTFQLVSMHGILLCATTYNAEFDAMFTSSGALYRDIPNSSLGSLIWHQSDLSGNLKMWDGNLFRRAKTIEPDLVGTPSRFRTPDDGGSGFAYTRALGSFQFPIGTYDASAAGATYLFADCRWLAYPRVAETSAGLYVPRQYIQPK